MAEQTTQNADAAKGAISRLRAIRLTWPAVLLFTALLAQAPHAGTVFFRIAPDHATDFENWFVFLGAFVYAIALEGATAYFVWHNKLAWAIAFATFSIMHNVAYYMPDGWAFNIAGEQLTLRYIVSGILISASLPIAIAAFSHVHVEERNKQQAGPAPAPAKRNAAPRRYFWQFWRPRSAVTAATNTPQRDRQTGLESLGDKNPTATITESEIEPHSAPPMGTAQALDDGGKPTEPAKSGKRPVNPNRDRALQMRNEGFTASEIAGLLGEKESTVASWLYRGAQKNGVAK